MAGILSENVTTNVNGTGIAGFMAQPDGRPPKASVAVIHEWWGLNDHIRDITQQLAREGFRSLAADLFEGKATKDANEAAGLMQGLDEATGMRKLAALVEFLKARPQSGKIGVIGFCLGGSYALLLPCHNRRIRAAVAFYGQVPPDEKLQLLERPVLYVYAGRDQWITRAEVERLERSFKRPGKPGQVVTYPSADHAFFNDTRREVYTRADDARDAWRRTLTFLETNLG